MARRAAMLRRSGRYTRRQSTSISTMKLSVSKASVGRSASVVDLTDEAAEFVDGMGDGLLSVFVPHATAGVAIIETGAGSDDDLLAALDDLLPTDGRWAHAHGSPGHGRDHVVPGFVPPSLTVPVIGGR